MVPLRRGTITWRDNIGKREKSYKNLLHVSANSKWVKLTLCYCIDKATVRLWSYECRCVILDE
jgi:hypothetical protein